MAMDFFSIIFIISSGISLLLAAYSLKNRRTPGAYSFAALMMAAVFYSFGYAFELSSDNYSQLIFWHKFEYIGIVVIAPSWIIFTLKFNGKQKWLTKPVLSLLYSFMVITFVLRFTNEYHHLFFKEIEFRKIGIYTIPIYTYGIWYYLHIISINIAIIISTIIFINVIRTQKGYVKSRAIVMLSGSLLLWFAFILFLFQLTPYDIDSSPFAFAIVGIVLAWGMSYYKILEISPFGLEQIFNSIKQIALIIDPEGILVNYNRQALNILNLNATHSEKLNLKSAFGELSEALSPLIEKEKESTTFSYVWRGEVREFYAEISKINNKKNFFLGYVITITDITEQKEIETKIRANEQKLIEANAAKEKFFRILAHDLKTPYSTIIPIANMLLDEAYEISGEDLHQLAESLHSAADSGYTLLLDLLEWGKLQTGKMEFDFINVHAYSTCAETISLLKPSAKSKGVTIHLEARPDLMICTDRHVFSTVLRNLISNAIKFSYPGGDVYVSILELSETFKISVRDFGVGITEKGIESLFKIDHFYTTLGTLKEKGTGIGLLVCKEMIEKVYGSIHVKSEFGKGSEFYFLLPK